MERGTGRRARWHPSSHTARVMVVLWHWGAVNPGRRCAAPRGPAVGVGRLHGWHI